MLSIVLLFLSAISPVIFLWLTLYFLRKQKVVHSLLFGLTCFYELVFVLYPTLYSICTGFELEFEIGIRAEDLVIVLAGHMVFVIMFLTGVMLFRTHGTIKKEGFQYRRTDLMSPQEQALLRTLVPIGLVVVLIRIATLPLEFEIIELHAEIKLHQSFISMLLYWFSSGFLYPTLVVVCYIAVDNRGFGRLISTIAIIIICLWIVSGLIVGFRGTLTRTVQLLIAFGIQKKNRKILITTGVLVLLMLAISGFLHSDMRTAVRTNLYRASVVEKLKFVGKNLIDGMLGKNEKIGYSNTLEEVAIRAEDVRSSVFLYDLYDQGRGAGANPLLSALYFPIPRVIWPGKRPPGSAGNTMYETAMHLVQIARGRPFYDMGPFLASAHAYWEGGWLWVVFAGLITGIFWKVILNWADKGGIIGIIVALTFAASLMTNGSATCLHPLYAFFPTFWSRILPVLVLSWGLKHLRFILVEVKLRQTSDNKTVIYQKDSLRRTR